MGEFVTHRDVELLAIGAGPSNLALAVALDELPPDDGNGTLPGWLTSLCDGSTVGSRYLAIGAGRDVNIPYPFTELPASRVIHSTRYIPRLAELAKDRPYRVAVVGGAQSAAEMF